MLYFRESFSSAVLYRERWSRFSTRDNRAREYLTNNLVSRATQVLRSLVEGYKKRVLWSAVCGANE